MQDEKGVALSSSERAVARELVEKDEERRLLAEKQSKFLGAIMAVGRIKNDRELSHLMEMSPPVISKLRNGHMAVSPAILVAINEVTGIPVRDMKDMLGYKVLQAKAKA